MLTGYYNCPDLTGKLSVMAGTNGDYGYLYNGEVLFRAVKGLIIVGGKNVSTGRKR
jgi:hypothetical protein